VTKKNSPSQYKSKKKDVIVDTAEKLFFQHGIKRITIEEICQRARVSKGTFYKYFPNKAGLVNCLVEKWQFEEEAVIQDFENPEIAFPKRLEAFFKRAYKFYSRMSMEFLDDYISIEKQINDFQDQALQYYVDAQERGDFRKDIRPELLAAFSDIAMELMSDKKLQSYYSSPAELTHEVALLYYLGASGTLRSDSDK
jgi:AcrR family transcriptional regulator